MPEFLTCFACDREPTQQCPRCGRPYCDEHGEELCDVCLQPSTGVPSALLYRGSLAALLVGTVLAVWFLIQPGGKTAGSGLATALQTPTVVASRQTPGTGATTAPGVVTTPSGSVTPLTTAAAGTTPGASTTASPRPTGSTTPSASGTGTPAAGAGTYTVVSGDTLGAICSAQRPALANASCVDSLRSLNSLSGDNISIGQSLKLP